MNTARDRSRGPIGATVQEALTALFAPALRRRLLMEALALEGAAEIPEDPVRARAFVEGPLRLVVKRRVGDVMAGFLLDTLGPIFGTDPVIAAPDAASLPAFTEDADDEDSRDTDVYDAESLDRLRKRLRFERRSGARLRVPSDPTDD